MAAYLIADDLDVGGSAALELGHHQPAVGAEPEHRDAVPACAGGGRQPVELEGHDLDGGAQDGRVRQHPLLQVGALLQARFLERDHLRRHRDGSSHGEQHFFRHLSGQGRASGRFAAGTESHTRLTTEPQNSWSGGWSATAIVRPARFGSGRCETKSRRIARAGGASRHAPRGGGGRRENCRTQYVSADRRPTRSDRRAPAPRAARAAPARPRAPGRGAAARRAAAR